MTRTFQRRTPRAVEPDAELVGVIAETSAVFDAADAFAALGDFQRALLLLERGEGLCGGLTAGYIAKRKCWQASAPPLRLV